MLHGLVAFLIFALIVLVVAYVIIRVISLIPGIPAPAPEIIRLVVGVIALILILGKALPLLGISAGI